MEKQKIHKYIHKADLNFECIRMMTFFKYYIAIDFMPGTKDNDTFDFMTICSVDTSEEVDHEWMGFVSQVKKTVVQTTNKNTDMMVTRLDKNE